MGGKKSTTPTGAGATPAFVALGRAGVTYTSHAYEHDPRAASFGLEAAEALGVPATRIFKTLMVDLDGTLVAALVPVSMSLDLKAVASALRGKRAQMANPQLAQRATGYVIGGISPLGQRTRHRTVIDHSAIDHATLFVSAGRRGSEAELAPQDLVSMTDAVLASIGRP